MKLKCIIVDDEPLAIEVIESYLARIEGVEIVATCNNAVMAFEILQKQSIDLMFLDIQMPKLTGIDFLKTLKKAPKVIFTTAYRDYAIESYDLDVVDYLLKPISFDRFLKAIGRVYQREPDYNGFASNGNAIGTETNGHIYLKADKKMVKILLGEILYIESLKDYVRVKTPHKEVISHQKISYLEEKLPEELFLRIHRSFIVSLNKVEAYSASSIEIPGKELPIGRNYKNQVLAVLGRQNNL